MRRCKFLISSTQIRIGKTYDGSKLMKKIYQATRRDYRILPSSSCVGQITPTVLNKSTSAKVQYENAVESSTKNAKAGEVTEV
jgi:predicted solute-binding protein